MLRNLQPEKPATIGFIACDAFEEVTREIWRGVTHAVREAKLNMVFFAGGPIHDPIGYRHQGNVIYDLITPERIDGLIILASSLNFAASKEEMKSFLHRYQQIPIICLEEEIAGLSCLMKDDFGGLKLAIEHLIHIHNRKRIVFMRGPSGFIGSQQRYQAYLDALKEHDLPFDPNLVTTPPVSWSYDEARTNFSQFLEDHALLPRFDFDAISASNDENALAAVHILQSMNVRVPDDISVIGFDDLALAGSNSPSLSTMRVPFFEMGTRAVELLLDNQIRKSHFLEVLPVQLIVRHSCGCLLPTISEASLEVEVIKLDIPSHSSLAAKTAKIRPEITREIAKLTGGLPPANRWAGQILNGFVSELDQGTQGTFLSALEETLNQVVSGGGRVKEWQRAISILRRRLFPYLSGTDQRHQATNLLHQARVMVGEVSWRNQSWKRLQANEQARQLRLLGARLATCLELDQLCDVLLLELPKLNIQGCFLSLYDNPKFPEGRAKLVLGYDRSGCLINHGEEIEYKRIQMLPEELWKKLTQFRLIIQSLHIKDELLGFIIFFTDQWEDTRDFGVFDALQMQVSSAVKSVLLYQDTQNARKEAEAGWRLAEERQQTAEEANQLKSRFLSMVSHDLRTPLNVITGLSENLLQDIPGNLPDTDHRILRDIERIYNSAQHLDNLMRDVLDLAVSQVGQLRLIYEKFYLDEAIKPVLEIAEKLTKDKGLVWQVEIDESIPLLSWDRTRMRQVVLNLITNAIKFTDYGQVRFKAEKETGEVVISVEDTGIGIPKDEQELIFEEFHRSDRAITRGYGGMGLGLAICRRLVELGGGKIGVISEGSIGQGSCFYFTIPISDQDEFSSASFSNQTVLVIQQNNYHDNELVEKLVAKGFEVEFVNYSRQSDWILTLLQSPPGAIILNFPPETDEPLEIIQALNTSPQLKEVPVMIYTTNQKEGRGMVFDFNYFEKPLSGSRLNKLIEDHGLQSDNRLFTILIVEDEPTILELHTNLIQKQYPSCKVIQAYNGRVALELMEQSKPDLVLLDLMMPEVNGFEVLEKMREKEILRNIPVIILTSQFLTENEMRLLNHGVTAVMQKGIFNEKEMIQQVEVSLLRNKRLGSEARRIARKAMAYVHENYTRNISRKEVAEYIGISPEYLSTCFNRETGVTLSAYIERYRVNLAKKMLETSEVSVTEVALSVGFCDSSYFGRIFRREVGVSPVAFRRGERK